MTQEKPREPARAPNDLERLLLERQWAGDIEGMVALYEEDAVLKCGNGPLAVGKAAIRQVFTELTAAGESFSRGTQSPAVLSGDLALTSTRLPDGTTTAEVARRQPDGTWLWVIDRFSV